MRRLHSGLRCKVLWYAVISIDDLLWMHAMQRGSSSSTYPPKRLLPALAVLFGILLVFWLHQNVRLFSTSVQKPAKVEVKAKRINYADPYKFKRKIPPVTQQRMEEADVVMIGDSIIQRLQTAYDKPDDSESLWDLLFTSYKSVNLGVGGITTQGLLDLIVNSSALDVGKPKIIVLLVGTNNVYDDPGEIVHGIQHIIDTVHQKQPQARIIVLELLPKGPEENPWREKNRRVNKLLRAKFKDPSKMPFAQLLNLDPGFVDENGNISPADMPDYLHLSYQAYVRAFRPLRSLIVNMMNEHIVTEYAKSQTNKG